MKENRSHKKFLFQKKNYKILFLAITIISFGFILMSGGGSKDPKFFNEEIFNFRRIRLAPIIVIIGFGIAIISILSNPSSKK